MVEAGVFGPDDRVELIEGEIIDMAPIGNPHASVVDRLTMLLAPRVANRAIVRVQSHVAFRSLKSRPEPDVILLKPRADFYRASAPAADDIFLLIEVMDTSTDYDRRRKAVSCGREVLHLRDRHREGTRGRRLPCLQRDLARVLQQRQDGRRRQAEHSRRHSTAHRISRGPRPANTVDRTARACRGVDRRSSLMPRMPQVTARELIHSSPQGSSVHRGSAVRQPPHSPARRPRYLHNDPGPHRFRPRPGPGRPHPEGRRLLGRGVPATAMRRRVDLQLSAAR